MTLKPDGVLCCIHAGCASYTLLTITITEACSRQQCIALQPRDGDIFSSSRPESLRCKGLSSNIWFHPAGPLWVHIRLCSRRSDQAYSDTDGGRNTWLHWALLSVWQEQGTSGQRPCCPYQCRPTLTGIHSAQHPGASSSALFLTWLWRKRCLCGKDTRADGAQSCLDSVLKVRDKMKLIMIPVIYHINFSYFFKAPSSLLIWFILISHQHNNISCPWVHKQTATQNELPLVVTWGWFQKWISLMLKS